MAFDAVIIDSHNLAFRSWWPCKDLCTKAGRPTGLEFGLIKNTLTIARENYPAQIVMAWDGVPKERKTLYPEYKANREGNKHDEEYPWYPRLNRLREAFSCLLSSLYHEELEADDQMARFVFQQEEEGKSTLIISNDTDMLQLVSDKTTVNASGVLLNVEAVKAKMGVTPDKLGFLRAISGDTSDNIPGVPRIPEEVKVDLAQRATSIEHLLELIDTGTFKGKQAEKLKDGFIHAKTGQKIITKDLIRLNYELMNLKKQAGTPVVITRSRGDSAELLDLCRELELSSQLDRKEWSLFSGEFVLSTEDEVPETVDIL